MRTRALGATAVAIVALTGCTSTSDFPDTVGATAPIAPSVKDGTPVPAVVGRRTSEARHLLEEAGFRVNEVEQRDCLLVDRVEETAPAPGTPIAAGSTVTLTSSGAAPNASCAYTPEEHAWDFLEWATGSGSASRLLDRRPGDLTEPPARWGPVAEIAHAAVSLIPTGDGTSAQPTVSATYETCPPLADCKAASWIDVRLTLAGRPYAALFLLLHRDRIASVAVSAAPPTP